MAKFGGGVNGEAGVMGLFSVLDRPKPVKVVADVPHAVYVEYGTANSPPQPFARPGTEEALANMTLTLGTFQSNVERLAVAIATAWRKKAEKSRDTGALIRSIKVVR